MKTTRVKVRRRIKDPDEELKNMLELYLMVPPPPLILKRIRGRKHKTAKKSLA